MPPLLDVAGQDATTLFYELHRSSVLDEPRFAKYIIGTCAVPELSAKEKKRRGKPGGPVPYGEVHGSWRSDHPVMLILDARP